MLRPGSPTALALGSSLNSIYQDLQVVCDDLVLLSADVDNSTLDAITKHGIQGHILNALGHLRTARDSLRQAIVVDELHGY